METKYAYVCHAEMNAVMNKNSQSLNGATVYVTMFPCNECAKLLIQSGIKEVVYFEGKLIESVAQSPAPATGGGNSDSSAAVGRGRSSRLESSYGDVHASCGQCMPSQCLEFRV